MTELSGNELEYYRAMDGLRFSQERKSRMTDALLSARQPVKSHRRLRPAIVALAALLVLNLTVGAAATGVLRSAGEIFAPILGGSPVQTEIIDKIGVPVNASDTDNGVTVSADAIIGDERNMVVVFTVSRDDGSPLFPDGDILPTWENDTMRIPPDVALNHVLFGPKGSSTHGGSYFTDYEPGNDSIQYVYDSSGDIRDYSTASFDNLGFYQDAEFFSVVEGHWEIPLKLDFEDSSVSLDVVSQSIRYLDFDITLDSLTVSPVGFALDYSLSCPPIESPSEEQDEFDRFLDDLGRLPVALRLKDGREIDLSSAGGGWVWQYDEEKRIVGGTGEKSGVFDEIISVENMDSVIVNGTEFPVEP